MRRDARRGVLLLVFPVLYYLVMGHGRAVFARYAVPLIPFVCVFAGAGVAALYETLRRRTRPAAGAAAAVVAVVLAAVPQAAKSLDLVGLLRAPDTRARCVRGLREALPDGTVLGWIGTTYGRPRFPESVEALQQRLADVKAKGGSGRLLEARIEVAGRRDWGLRVEDLDLGESGAEWPDWVLVEDYPIAWVRSATDGAEPMLRSRGYERVQVFAGAEAAVFRRDDVVFDIQDSFYIPMSGLHRVAAPGPTLTLWRTPRNREQKAETSSRGWREGRYAPRDANATIGM